MSVSLDFGKPWAAAGEQRPHQFRTPLAWVAGMGDGVLLVQVGTDACERGWVLVSEWAEWVAAVSAAPVDLSALETSGLIWDSKE